MTTRTKFFLAASTALALGACGEAQLGSPFYSEAGAFIDEGQFGNPTMNNTLIQNGERSYATNLNARFAEAVPTMVNFAFDSAVLDADAQAVLREQANFIRQFPEVQFRVYGHTDAVGSEAYNKDLGLRRARAVVNFLASQGVSRSRLEALVSFGETRPLVVTNDRERRNRRTVTEVSGFVQSHPAVLDGRYAAILYREYVGSAVEQPPNAGGGIAAIEGGG
ncbi:MAG: OmpA family protein [Paracoccaceae bacterium]|nr:OmpA family protein [Paracoccaceae bacterium]